MFAHTRAALAHFGAELRDTLPHLVVSVHAFGSRVRGDHRGDSDLDVLVVVRERTLEVERSIIDLCVAHEQRSGISFDPVIKDVATFDLERQRHTPFYQNVSAEGLPI